MTELHDIEIPNGIEIDDHSENFDGTVTVNISGFPEENSNYSFDIKLGVTFLNELSYVNLLRVINLAYHMGRRDELNEQDDPWED
jgi:hypothetical protein